MRALVLTCIVATLALVALSSWDLLMADDRLRRKAWSLLLAGPRLIRKLLTNAFVLFVALVLLVVYGFDRIRPKVDS